MGSTFQNQFCLHPINTHRVPSLYSERVKWVKCSVASPEQHWPNTHHSKSASFRSSKVEPVIILRTTRAGQTRKPNPGKIRKENVVATIQNNFSQLKRKLQILCSLGDSNFKKKRIEKGNNAGKFEILQNKYANGSKSSLNAHSLSRPTSSLTMGPFDL